MKFSKDFLKALGSLSRGTMVHQGNYKVAQFKQPLIKPHGYDELVNQLVNHPTAQQCCCAPV
ncbi:hypothetical protein J6I75_00095 [Pseudidiomarina sp. 1APP75-27a]|uniref:hypothetical protein n=1 Tax=Pseudidiomarina terrestris TaxID=2820060 RepID=UPI00264F90CC|nr:MULTISPECIES: hypothetical protein [unclassified Pseudidiomarina]MDN7138994.1 hypothetical protein [Pseudidiomarina sp. 1ASP75-14]MEA3586757.1 hypothetical protein [Pseudidiomarina sp. 1APP75-27a]